MLQEPFDQLDASSATFAHQAPCCLHPAIFSDGKGLVVLDLTTAEISGRKIETATAPAGSLDSGIFSWECPSQKSDLKTISLARICIRNLSLERSSFSRSHRASCGMAFRQHFLTIEVRNFRLDKVRKNWDTFS